MKSDTNSPIVKLALVGILSMGLYYASEGVKSLANYAKALPVEGTVQKEDPNAPKVQAKLSDKESIHPILIESKKKLTQDALPKSEGPVKSLDEIFGKAEEPLTRLSAPSTPVFTFSDIKSRVRVQGILNNGAVINGKFFEVGAKVTTAPYYNDNATATLFPKLMNISGDTVVLKSAKGSTVRLSLTK